MKPDATRDALTAMSAEIAAIKNELASLRERDGMSQNRQVLPLDSGMLAVRHSLGWIVLPSEDFASVVHLADGVAGHEAGSLSVMRRFVRPGDMVIDLGAHIGLHSIPLARAVGPEGRLVAVEPLPRTAECLRRSLVCNGLLDQSTIVIAAASDASGMTEFYLGDNSMLGSLYPAVDEHKPVDVRVVRIDEIMGSEVRVDFVKMDVEGAELKALAGMTDLIARNPNIAMIAEYGPVHLERVGINPADWFEAFADTGLGVALVIDEADGSLSRVDLKRIEQIYSANILFVKNVERVAAAGIDIQEQATI